jgi:hypothetical protein
MLCLLYTCRAREPRSFTTNTSPRSRSLIRFTFSSNRVAAEGEPAPGTSPTSRSSLALRFRRLVWNEGVHEGHAHQQSEAPAATSSHSRTDWLPCSVTCFILAGLKHLRDKIRTLDVNGDGKRAAACRDSQAAQHSQALRALVDLSDLLPQALHITWQAPGTQHCAEFSTSSHHTLNNIDHVKWCTQFARRPVPSA